MSVFSKLTAALRGKKWAQWLGYAAFSWGVFTFALFLTFPSDAVRDRVVLEARKMGMNLRVESTGLAFPLGLSLHDTFLILREPNPEEQQGALAIHVEKITLRPDLFAMVRGDTGLRFDATLWGGKAAGRLHRADGEQKVSVRAKRVDLSKSVLVAMGLDLEGILDELSLEYEGSDLSKAKGTLAIGGEGLVLRGGEVAEFELPRITLGALKGQIAMGDGRAEIEEFTLEGTDLQARIEGNVRLAPAFSQSTLNAKLSFKPSDSWWKANEMLQAGASMALPPDRDGFHSVTLYGPVGKPRFRTR